MKHGVAPQLVPKLRLGTRSEESRGPRQAEARGRAAGAHPPHSSFALTPPAPDVKQALP
jgi:hypothetical protein